MTDYIDRTVLKLKRKYSKDELVDYLTNRESELLIEIGTLKSERDELMYELDKIKKMDNDEKSKLCQDKYIKGMKDEIKSLRNKCRKLDLENSKLIHQVAQLNLKLNN